MVAPRNSGVNGAMAKEKSTSKVKLSSAAAVAVVPAAAAAVVAVDVAVLPVEATIAPRAAVVSLPVPLRFDAPLLVVGTPPNSGLGIFTLKDLEPDTQVGESDLVIPMKELESRF